MPKNKRIADQRDALRERRLPEEGTLAGYGALLQRFSLRAPVPRRLSLISERHRQYEDSQWRVFTIRHLPPDTLGGHLTFALRYEGIDLAVLSALFTTIEAGEIEALVRENPVGSYSRRIWFLYEWLTERLLDLPDATTGNYTSLVDEELQYAGPARSSRRHRVRNNLPGTQAFCPLIWKTPALERLLSEDLAGEVKKVVGAVHPALLARAAAFLLLQDSRASFDIEGEKPPSSRVERWGRIIGEAGARPLDAEELLRLQSIVIGDARFTRLGWRRESGFVGAHDRRTGEPIPDHISARWQDVPSLIAGLVETEKLLRGAGAEPLLAAAAIAFGFVFIHPFEDGNGRIHRYLIHHILASHGFTPKGVAFPVSAVILERIEEYRRILEAHSRPRLELVEWRATERANIEVRNQTRNLYRFFDATLQAEFLGECVRETVRRLLPEEVKHLERYDRMKRCIDNLVDMPDNKVDVLIRFLEQGRGKLSRRAITKEFAALTAGERARIEQRYREIFGAGEDHPAR